MPPVMNATKMRLGSALAATAFLLVVPAIAPAAPVKATQVRTIPPKVKIKKSSAIERPVRKIALFINEEPLSTEVPPRVIGGRVYLPLRVVFQALGVDEVHLADDAIEAPLPEGKVQARVGSPYVTTNGRVGTLDAPVLRQDGAVYVPLRFFSEAVGALVSYDQRAGRAEIFSAYIGRNIGPEQPGVNGGRIVTGVLSAIDLNSASPSVTVVAGGQETTVNVPSSAIVYIEDATIHSQRLGKLNDLHVGDALRAIVRRDGRVVEVHDFFKSRNGTIQAISSSAFVLEDGSVITPSRDTTIELNDAQAKLGDLQVGDYVTVRSNPESGELREIIASRTAEQTAAPVAPVSITSFALSEPAASRPLREGESLSVVMHGTRGGTATFDIGDVLTGTPMRETSPGVYVARFTVPARFDLARVPVFGRLTVGGVSAPRAEASGTLSTATMPPQILDVAPPPGQTVNTKRPALYAQFASPVGVGLNPSSAQIWVNGHDETAAAVRTGSFITYNPGVDLQDGDNRIVVRVADAAGNIAVRSWTFSINAR